MLVVVEDVVVCVLVVRVVVGMERLSQQAGRYTTFMSRAVWMSCSLFRRVFSTSSSVRSAKRSFSSAAATALSPACIVAFTLVGLSPPTSTDTSCGTTAP